MTEFFFNGVPMSEQEMYTALDEAQEQMVEAEQLIEEKYGVSTNTAAAILYLRGRSRWTKEKEQELIDRDKAGNPISLETVLSGEF